jgi:ABC-type uncharacterized transport system permease subunit
VGDVKLSRGKIAIGIVVALVVGVLLALVHGSGSAQYHEPGQRPARVN